MRNTRAKSMTMCAMFTVLIAVGAFIKIPIPVVSFTLQFLFTLMAGLLLGGKLGAISVGLYAALGLAGLPIFAEGGGIWYLMKPSFGYIIGFIIATYVTGKMTEKMKEFQLKHVMAAKDAGLSICSGGILGLGETMEDRIDMVLTARSLGVKSIPVNVLNPIQGTPYEKNPVLSNEEVCRCVAIFRFLIPDGSIRLAGGRGLLGDKGQACFKSGANAAISGDMLTTSGINMETDMKLLGELGFEVKLCND